MRGSKRSSGRATAVVALRRLSDILLALGRKDEAASIYKGLSTRIADGPEVALYCALSFERLLAPRRSRRSAQARNHPISGRALPA